MRKEKSWLLATVVVVWWGLSLLMTACVDWEALGEGVAKGQGTADVGLAKGQTAVAKGVATAEEGMATASASYERERARQGATSCASALLPLLICGLGIVAVQRGWSPSRLRPGRGSPVNAPCSQAAVRTDTGSDRRVS